MTTEDIIIHIFYIVDEQMKAVKRVPQTHLYPSEIVTIGVLFALKGGHFRAFYRWLKRDYAPLFAGLPDRTNLQRLLKTHQQHCDKLLAASTLFSVTDSYPIELLFPIRQGRSAQQIGKDAPHSKSARKARTKAVGLSASSSAGLSIPLAKWWGGSGRR